MYFVRRMSTRPTHLLLWQLARIAFRIVLFARVLSLLLFRLVTAQNQSFVVDRNKPQKTFTMAPPQVTQFVEKVDEFIAQYPTLTQYGMLNVCQKKEKKSSSKNDNGGAMMFW